MARHGSSGYFGVDAAALDLDQQMRNRIEELDHARRSVIDELRRWRDCDDLDQVRGSIDQALNMLERA